MLTITSIPAASTLAAPLIAQNRGVGRESMAFTISIPVGNPKPVSTPEGTMAMSETPARTRRFADANASTSIGAGSGTGGGADLPGHGRSAAAFCPLQDGGAHFGLTPRRFQSGETDHDGRISKCGDAMRRTALYEVAQLLLT